MNIKQLHFDVMDGKTDYIPLIINTVDRFNHKPITPFESMHHPQRHIDAFLLNNAQNLQLPTDRDIVMESNFLECLIPSMFGAKVYESPGGYIDVKPIFEDICETENITLAKGMLDMATEHLHYLKKNTPDTVKIAITRFMSPLDYAVVMRGGDFYMDILLEPEISMNFLNKIADVTLDTLRYFKNENGEDYHEQLTVARGIHIRGTRLTGDSIVNLSPSTIKTVLHPLFSRFKNELGGLMLHYCCTPAPSGHVLPVLAECGSVDCVDNWQGYETFFNTEKDGLLQDKVGMCFDVPFEQLSNIDKFMQQPLLKDVKRKGGRGLFVMTTTDDLEKSKRLYDDWKNYFIT